MIVPTSLFSTLIAVVLLIVGETMMLIGTAALKKQQYVHLPVYCEKFFTLHPNFEVMMYVSTSDFDPNPHTHT